MVAKYIIGHVYKPLLVKYLSRARAYHYKGIKLMIPPEVFHPGFFSSTKLLLKYVATQPLNQRSVLELGAGSGLISMFAVRKGAKVTATDINLKAIEYLRTNTSSNRLNVDIIHSDLFKDIPPQTFDYIAINPPYYKKEPRSQTDYAWYCGPNGEYFEGLFSDLLCYMHSGTKVFMILCDGCDIKMIKEMAAKNRVELKCVHKSKNWIESNFIFKIEPIQ